MIDFVEFEQSSRVSSIIEYSSDVAIGSVWGERQKDRRKERDEEAMTTGIMRHSLF